MNSSENSAARRLPAEWEPQDGVLLTWPHDQSDWRPFLAEVEPVYVEIARAVCARERLLVCVRDAQHREHVQALLDAGGVASARVQLCIAGSNDSWARDHGPITVFDEGSPRLLDFRFNGWGGKYEAALDDRISATLAAAGSFGSTPLDAIDFVLEGGAIESDGAGVLLTTATCLLAPGRNPAFSRAQIEQRLGELFGLQRVLWLEHGFLEGDDTDSHIDTLARFCDPGTIAYVRCDDPHDAHHPALAAMEQELMALRDQRGAPYRLCLLYTSPSPRDRTRSRMPSSA